MHTAPAEQTSIGPSSAPLLPRHGKIAFFLVTGLFFLWAIPNNLNDVLIRQFMKSFEISRLEAGLVQSAFMSLMFPTIFALGIRDLGPHTKEGASLIVMAIIGGAVFTPLMGLVFQATQSMAVSMSIPLLCYGVVAVFGFGSAGSPPSKRLQSFVNRG